jgi:hypothetical protein
MELAVTRFYQNAAIFLPVAVLAGVVHWWRHDWVIYDTIDGERFAMIEIDWWIQLPVSAVVGILCGGLAVAIVCAVRWLWSRRSNRSMPTARDGLDRRDAP